MMLKDSILNLHHGDRLHLKDRRGVIGTFQVNIEDALLNGESQQVWLKDNQSDESVFLRKKPQDSKSVGYALFLSLSELANTIESGQFYIG